MGIRGEAEAQKDRLFLWLPVAFGAGIALYFGLRFEPAWWTGSAIVMMAAPAVYLCWRRHHDSLPWFFVFLAVAGLYAAALGFTAAQGATQRYGTPILQKEMKFADVEGTVESVEHMGGTGGSRAVLSHLVIEGVDAPPRKIRLRFKKDEGLVAGTRIKTLAQLQPPGRAVAPGAYDFRRHLFFEGIGAVGFSYRAPEITGDRTTGVDLLFENTREIVGRHIHKHAGAVAAGIMTALITGERGAIAEEDNDAMRESGLYHLLSISGTHVTMVAGVLFFFARFLMACFPWVALHWPIKKIAAGVALSGAAFYVLLAGADVPAVRALLMTALIMIAVMLDRSPFSLRLIAFAALAVLAVLPSALIGVSFQMSFAAVAALICFFDYIRPWWMAWYSRVGFIRKGIMYLIAVMLTSIIAGTVTGLFSLYHFQSFAVYGVLSNMLAVPLTGVVIMPAAMLALILMPFGLESIALHIMEWGVIWMLAIAHWAASLDGAVIHVRQWPEATFAFFVGGLILFLLWEGWRGKGIAACLILTGFIIAGFSKLPDVIVAESGKLVAVRSGGEIFVSTGRAERFAVENWMRLSGHEGAKPKTFRSKNSPVLCDGNGCRVKVRGKKVAMPKNPKAFAEDCAWANLIVGEIPLKKRECEAPIVLDLYDFRDDGAHGIYLGDKIRVRSAGEEAGVRPWTAQSGR